MTCLDVDRFKMRTHIYLHPYNVFVKLSTEQCNTFWVTVFTNVTHSCSLVFPLPSLSGIAWLLLFQNSSQITTYIFIVLPMSCYHFAKLLQYRHEDLHLRCSCRCQEKVAAEDTWSCGHSNYKSTWWISSQLPRNIAWVFQLMKMTLGDFSNPHWTGHEENPSNAWSTICMTTSGVDLKEWYEMGMGVE